MNNRELQKIIEQIQEKEGVKIIAIAKKAIVNRSYLSSLINDEKTYDVESAFIGKLTKAFPTYFEKQQKPTTPAHKIDQILTNLTELRGYAIAILTGQSAGHEVIMGALDRLESNPEGSLSEAADKLALQLAERLNKIQKGMKADAGS